MLIPTRWHAQAILVRSHRSKHGHKDLAKQRRPSPAGPTTVIIGVSDSSKTVNVHVGQIVALDLNRYLNWSVVPPSSSALKPLGSLNAHSRFKAVTPGVVALRATGRPVPRPGQMTAMFIINFNVSINIQK